MNLVRKQSKAIYLFLGVVALTSYSGSFAQESVVVSLEETLKNAQTQADAFPKDAKRRFDLAEALRNSHDMKRAAVEYSTVTRLDPTYYLAYHNLVLCKPSPEQVKEAVDRLTTLEKEKPSALMVRISLSEMLERKGEYYQAARTLVDIEYSHTIPDKYQKKITGRIHYLLMKAKDVDTLDEAKQPAAEAESDSSPLPLPDSSMDKDLSSTKLREQDVTESYGHARLLP